MEVTEVKVKLVDIKTERLKAFCTITLDGEFVVRDIKVIEGGTGPFVAMPSRKLAEKCPRCGTKNHLRSKHCNECGSALPESRVPKDSAGRIKLHADIAHPINPQCRQRIQDAVLQAYFQEIEHSKSPEYVPPNLDDFEHEGDTSRPSGT
jgi:stage V sporulation protein G